MNVLKEEFDKNGYIAIRNFVSRETLDKINACINDLTKEKLDSMPPEYVFYENKADASTLKQLQHINLFQPFFDELLLSDQFKGLAEILLGTEVEAKNMQWFNKPPRIGKETPAHQDGYYFMLEPNEALTMWLAIDSVDEKNGCVRYIPASHKNGMRPYTASNVLGFSQGISDYHAEDQAMEIPMIVEPGDIIIHHSLTIHRADPNTSVRTRKGLGFIYYSTLAHEDKVKHAAYQEKLKETLKQQDKI